MTCPQCNNSILSPSLPRASVLSYRGFEKTTGSEVYLSCSYCSYEDSEPYKSTVNIEEEMNLFRKEINMKLSGGSDVYN